MKMKLFTGKRIPYDNKRADPERLFKMVDMQASGMSTTDIGRKFGLSRQRIWKILKANRGGAND